MPFSIKGRRRQLEALFEDPCPVRQLDHSDHSLVNISKDGPTYRGFKTTQRNQSATKTSPRRCAEGSTLLGYVVELASNIARR